MTYTPTSLEEAKEILGILIFNMVEEGYTFGIINYETDGKTDGKRDIKLLRERYEKNYEYPFDSPPFTRLLAVTVVECKKVLQDDKNKECMQRLQDENKKLKDENKKLKDEIDGFITQLRNMLK